jgi:tetratricopeptide (TPR) repeat protein
MKRRDNEGMHIFPVIIKSCFWEEVDWLSEMQVRPKFGKPLHDLTAPKRETELKKIAKEMFEKIKGSDIPEKGKKPVTQDPDKISLSKMPTTSPVLFGREKELKMLNKAWSDIKTNIVCLVAWGGVGKTALVNKWLLDMRKKHFRNAKKVFGYSFYSQGAEEGKQASADIFIDYALKWFGDKNPEEGNMWEKGERLAEYINKSRTLLVLDGLEPLQHPPGEMEGKLKDPALICLLKALAVQNRGLCVVTTRLHVDDLKQYEGETANCKNLEDLSNEAGVAVLKNLGVKGTADELKQASKDFEGHALALTLLGSYLNVVYNGEIRDRDKIEKLTDEEKQGAHARRVMESYERWFEGNPELDVLYIMGLFDRPAVKGAFDAVIKEPEIQGLTTKLQNIGLRKWQFALNNLRNTKLLAEKDPADPDTLDCHPLVREHFGEKLQKENSEAWKEANLRLYEFYKNSTIELPETLEEMMPLYAAITHGCRAGRYQETLEEVYWSRILRGKEHYSWKKLGTLSADLAAISSFFEFPWHKPAEELSKKAKSFLIGQTGLYLIRICRLSEAVQPMEAALIAFIEQNDWKNANRVANNLSELNLTYGKLSEALKYAKKSVEFADKSKDEFERLGIRTTLADALHHSGNLEEAEKLFIKAEEIQKNWQKEYPVLYSLQGSRYCDLLLGKGKYKEVIKRAVNALKIAERNNWLIDIGLDNLSLGRAYLLQCIKEKRKDYSESETYLDRAVDGLRKAGSQDEIPRGFLARAEYYITIKNFEKAEKDLKEAFTIADRGGMRLYLADCYLGYARLYMAKGEREKAKENLKTAKEMIEDMGYHRRDNEVKELEKQLLG